MIVGLSFLSLASSVYGSIDPLRGPCSIQQYEAPFFAAIQSHRLSPFCVLLAADGSFIRFSRDAEGHWFPIDAKFNGIHMYLETSILGLRGDCKDLFHADNVNTVLEAVLPEFIPSLTSEQMRALMGSTPSLDGEVWTMLSTLLSNLSIPRSAEELGQVIERADSEDGFGFISIVKDTSTLHVEIRESGSQILVAAKGNTWFYRSLSLTLNFPTVSLVDLGARFDVKLISDFEVDCQQLVHATTFWNGNEGLTLCSDTPKYELHIVQNQSNQRWDFRGLQCGLVGIGETELPENPQLADKINQLIGSFTSRYEARADKDLLLLANGSRISLAELCDLLINPPADVIIPK